MKENITRVPDTIWKSRYYLFQVIRIPCWLGRILYYGKHRRKWDKNG